jgi:hypothetical protein
MRRMLTSEQLEGIHERLARANQNVQALDADLGNFLRPLPFVEIKVVNGEARIGDAEKAAWKAVQECAQKNRVPLQFSIRAGEIIHHLRSCLDHIAWQLSDPLKREARPGKVHFPVVTDWNDPDETARYKRQTEFISDVGALDIIKKLQPAGSDVPKDNPLWVVHYMDIVDKHRALSLILWVPHFHGPSTVTRDYAAIPMPGAYRMRMLIPIVNTAQVQAEMKLSLTVAFAEIGRRKDQPVIKSLVELSNAIRDAVGLFGG